VLNELSQLCLLQSFTYVTILRNHPQFASTTSLNYLLAIVVWILLSAVWGLGMVGIGPGIVMLFVGLILGVCGAVFSVIQLYFTLRMPIVPAGIVIAVLATLTFLVIFTDSQYSVIGFLYFLVVNLVASVPILYFVRKATSSSGR
jgi:hypothetical protein